MAGKTKQNSKADLKVKEKIDHVLDEIRVVLPGTHALLGFQLNAFFSSGFDKIPQLLRNLHLISLGFITISIMLLMTPVAYHRIVEGGEDTRRFHDFSSIILLLTLVFLGLGMATDIFVVVAITAKSYSIAFLTSLISIICFYLCWFGYTLLKRAKE